MKAPGIKVGELARLCGVSVRTLHHWDDIGLLSPPDRTPTGHRRYSRKAIAKVAQIRALQQLGLTLSEIQLALTQHRIRLHELVHEHQVRMRRQLVAQWKNLEDLERVSSHLRRYPQTAGDDLARLVEYVRLSRAYFTRDQREILERRCDAMGPERIAANRTARREALVKIRREHERGTGGDDRLVQSHMARYEELTRDLTGDDPDIQDAIARLCHEEPDFRVRRGVDDRFYAFLQRLRSNRS